MPLLSRIPGALILVSAAMFGWTVGPIVAEDQWRPAGIVLTAGTLAAGLVLSDRRVRARLGWVPPRARLSVLWDEWLDIRSHLKIARRENRVVRSEWDSRISQQETRMWTVLQDVLPEDWRPLKRGLASFTVVDTAGYPDDQRWAMAMLDFIEKRLTMLREQMDKMRPPPKGD